MSHPPVIFTSLFDIDELRQTCHQLLAVDVRPGTDDELLAATTELGQLVSCAERAHACLLAELDARGTTDRVHGMRTAFWAAAATGAVGEAVAPRPSVRSRGCAGETPSPDHTSQGKRSR